MLLRLTAILSASVVGCATSTPSTVRETAETTVIVNQCRVAVAARPSPLLSEAVVRNQAREPFECEALVARALSDDNCTLVAFDLGRRSEHRAVNGIVPPDGTNPLATIHLVVRRAGKVCGCERRAFFSHRDAGFGRTEPHLLKETSIVGNLVQDDRREILRLADMVVHAADDREKWSFAHPGFDIPIDAGAEEGEVCRQTGAGFSASLHSRFLYTD